LPFGNRRDKYLVSEFDFAELSRFFEELVENIMYGQSLPVTGRLKGTVRLKFLSFLLRNTEKVRENLLWLFTRPLRRVKNFM